MTRFFISLTAFVLMAFAFAHVAPRFIDADFLAAQIEARLTEATGHDVSVDPKVAFQILPRPAFQVSNVRIEQTANSVAEVLAPSTPLVSAKAATAYVHPWALVFGQVQAQRIELVAPIIQLDRDADGRTAWDNAPIFASLTSGTSILREQDNRAAAQRGFATQIVLAGAVANIEDALTGYQAQWQIPVLTLSPQARGAALRFDGAFRSDDWVLEGRGDIDFDTTAEGETKRHFTSSWRGENKEAQIAFTTLALEGELSDQVLNRLRVTSAEQWRARVEDFRHPSLTAIVSAFARVGEGEHVVDFDIASVTSQGALLDLAGLEIALRDALDPDQTLFRMAGAAELTRQPTASTLTLALSANQQSLPDNAMAYWGANASDLVAQIGRSIGSSRVEFSIAFQDIMGGGPTPKVATGQATGHIDQTGLTLDQAALTVPNSLAVVIDQARVPTQGIMDVTGSLSARVPENAWLTAILPEISVLSPTVETLDVTGQVGISLGLAPAPGANRVQSLENTTLIFDDAIQLGVALRRTGVNTPATASDTAIEIHAASLDLGWLPQSSLQPEFGGAELLDADISSFFDVNTKLVSMAQNLDATSISLRVDRAVDRTAALDFGKSEFLIRQDDPGQYDVTFDVGGDLGLAGQMSVRGTGTTSSGSGSGSGSGAGLALVQGEAVVSPGSAWQNRLGMPANWPDVDYLRGDPALDLRVTFDRESGWQFRQENHLVVLPPKATLVQWQKTPVSTSDMVKAFGGPRAQLFAQTPVAGRGVVSVTRPELGAFSLLGRAGQGSVTMNGERTSDKFTLSADGFQPLRILPDVRAMDMDVQLVPASQGAWPFEASGEGWQARGKVSDGHVDLNLDANSVTLDQLLNTLSSVTFGDGILMQGRIDIAVSLAQLLDQDQSVLATDVAMSGTMEGGRFSIAKLSLVLSSGELVVGKGHIDILGGLFGELTFEMAAKPRTLRLGPFAAATNAGRVQGTAKINGTSAAQIRRNLIVSLDPKALPITLTFDQTRAQMPMAWQDALSSDEGAKLIELANSEIDGGLYAVAGQLIYRRGQWRLPQLSLVPSSEDIANSANGASPGDGFASVVLEGSLNPLSRSIDGSAQVRAFDGREAILAVSNNLLAPKLRLLGAYFRE